MQRGLVPLATIDSAVAGVLRAKFELGLFEHPYTSVDSAARWNGAEEDLAIALEAARNSLVLLRNEGQTLPLSNAIRSLAVIGSDAVEARLGGYSGPGVKPVSILDALRARLGDRVRFAAGPGRHVTDVEPVDSSAWDGLRGEYFDNVDLTGTPHLIRDESRLDFASAFGAPGEGIARDWYSVRWIGRLTVPGPRARRLGAEGNDGYRLWIDGRLALDNPRPRSFGLRFSNVVLEPGRTYTVRVEYREPAGNGRIRRQAPIRELQPRRRAGGGLDRGRRLPRGSAVARRRRLSRPRRGRGLLDCVRRGVRGTAVCPHERGTDG
jgi:beta-glucosidase